jgi:hypothetical protein
MISLLRKCVFRSFSEGYSNKINVLSFILPKDDDDHDCDRES